MRAKSHVILVPIPAAEQLAADHEAFREEAAAINVENEAAYNLDAVYAASSAINTYERVLPFRPTLAKLIEFELKNLDKLPPLAHALLHVQHAIVARTNKVSLLAPHASEAYELRSMLLAYADVLVMTKLIAAETIARIREGSGYRDLIEDLGALDFLYRSTKGATTGAITKQHLDRAGELASLMTPELQDKLHIDEDLAPLLLDRRQFAVLLTRAHHQVHRAMSYLRDGRGDLDQLVPSLVVPGGPRSAASQEPAPPAVTNQRVTAVADQPAPAVSTDPLDKPFDNR